MLVCSKGLFYGCKYIRNEGMKQKLSVGCIKLYLVNLLEKHLGSHLDHCT
jgi:hypothetical protein